jgi:hypothetical protein
MSGFCVLYRIVIVRGRRITCRGGGRVCRAVVTDTGQRRTRRDMARCTGVRIFAGQPVSGWAAAAVPEAYCAMASTRLEYLLTSRADAFARNTASTKLRNPRDLKARTAIGATRNAARALIAIATSRLRPFSQVSSESKSFISGTTTFCDASGRGGKCALIHAFAAAGPVSHSSCGTLANTSS